MNAQKFNEVINLLREWSEGGPVNAGANTVIADLVTALVRLEEFNEHGQNTEWCLVHEEAAMPDRYHSDRCVESIRSGDCLFRMTSDTPAVALVTMVEYVERLNQGRTPTPTKPKCAYDSGGLREPCGKTRGWHDASGADHDFYQKVS